MNNEYSFSSSKFSNDSSNTFISSSSSLSNLVGLCGGVKYSSESESSLHERNKSSSSSAGNDRGAHKSTV